MYDDGSGNDGAAQRFVQQQHKIVKKYGITGHLSFAEVAFFHGLINSGSNLIVAAFEVFALDRDSDAFLENLRIIVEAGKRMNLIGDNMGGEPKVAKRQKRDTSDYLDFLEVNKAEFSKQEYDMLEKLAISKSPYVTGAIDLFDVNNDKADMVNTLKQLIKFYTS
jgi:hypothetical protein